ncbi:A24 family peptidase [Nocardia sp. NPDC024068]|uniref:A24 family peptidase n=1 Tax=Nocardia sp. NPDC024068 TaxID=3157197 RepID=UPI0033FFF777
MAELGFLLVLLWCCALSVADIRTRRLPNRLTLPGAGVVLGCAAAAGEFGTAIRGAVLLAVPYLVVHLLRPAALGAGDVKLALGLGAVAALGGGTHAWVWSAVAAPLCTAAAGAGLLLAARTGSAAAPGDPGIRARSRSPDHHVATVPHGPSMCVATLIGLVVW